MLVKAGSALIVFNKYDFSCKVCNPSKTGNVFLWLKEKEACNKKRTPKMDRATSLHTDSTLMFNVEKDMMICRDSQMDKPICLKEATCPSRFPELPQPISDHPPPFFNIFFPL